MIFSCLVVCFCLVALGATSRAEEPDYHRLCQELKKSGFKIVYSGLAYGVPFVEIEIPQDFSITRLCRRVPSFNRDFDQCRNRISFFNALHPSYIKTRTREPFSIESSTLRVPLDLYKMPEIFPAYDKSLVQHGKYLLVDIGKGFLAFYVAGELKRVFPISAGAPGQKTPLITFAVQAKFQNHWSTIYETWMPWALLLQRPYYIHGGALPGKNDSAGCIRLFTHHAQELFDLVEVGTPGRIIHTPKLDRTHPVPFCR
ncbi:MAG: L,D-transpeptidase [Deltaproteobacteria bacterium]|nr:L,D-transpeptidase [Deltaproteobacteria bacterium]MBW1953563.1 L,D-transpeptidase [Deltaproteobacteria bacterium]MBW1987704.1 L,D-transpeptidase [Deltaproteobacteria bacterium]MBW2135732.1 L,D-transpeptidase [Deltaproteobacteria bacterium]